MNNVNEQNIQSNFIHNIIDKDLSEGVYDNVHTRFPPEPNGYLHIGHAKAICINFSIAGKYQGKCNLRFDDTNPDKEDTEYVESIKRDIKWLGFDWGETIFYASDYYGRLYDFAEELIKKGKAFVCDLTAEQMREYRGTLTQTGKESPYRSRSVEENLQLFRDMRNGKYKDGERVLRAKIDMTSPNINMRDPVIYRIMHTSHHRIGDAWCIYPMYDYAHPISDALENITHSLCSLEFEDHRPLYDWVLKNLDEFPNPPKQREFARLELTNTVTSKRKLKALVDDGVVEGWDDPRMPTVSALRRRGYTPEAIKDFIQRIGVAKSGSKVDYALLEHCVREDLKLKTSRLMAAVDPIKVVITNYPEGQTEYLEIENNRENDSMGYRTVPFSRELYIDAADFREVRPRKYFRLYPGNEVRLMGAYFVTCTDVVKNEDGSIKEVHCTYDPATKSGSGFTERKVKGTIHWVSAPHAVKAELRIYQHIFNENEETGEMQINPNSLTILNGYIEESIKNAKIEEKFQFMRNGYFCVDKKATDKKMVLNEIVSLKSSYNI
jgi:glutaminyl-tRNA synthetase